MSTPHIKGKSIQKSCPICGINYLTSKKLPAPTCGNPNCIREARARGLPFAPLTSKPSVKPEKPKKPKKEKPQKPATASF